MKGKNMILLSVAVLAIGLFVLPQTMAMFVGQHTWYSVKTTDAQYEMCQKCHVNEVAEWAENGVNGGAHSTYESEFPNEGCFCHQINTTSLEEFDVNLTAINAKGFNYTHWNESGDLNASNWYWRPTTTPHAAVIIDCVDCHYNESQQIMNTNSAHYAFWNETKNADNSDNNTACMACHTHTHLNITWIRLSGINIIANHTDASADPYNAWNITVEAGGYNTTYTNTSSYGS